VSANSNAWCPASCLAPALLVDSDCMCPDLFPCSIWTEHADLLAAHKAVGGASVVTGNGLAFMAGRVSYTFGLTGDSLSSC
jgi:hypothetical protein